MPLVKDVQNENTDTLILNSKGWLHSLNTRYQVPATADIIDTLHFMSDGAPATSEGIHHVYDIPSIKPSIRYLHWRQVSQQNKHGWNQSATEAT